ncbi:hypothetical protein PPUJ20066_45330 [Pseudomonas putida]|jgi:hypothetical protein|nr:hypothetical protein CR512_16405 [Pseudomonas putida]GLO58497.1 hypothetical protein PPUJ20066_45330 [Pseudomonas putida]
MTTGKRFTEADAPAVEPGHGEDWPTGKDEDDTEAQTPTESQRGSGHPDPSRASAAERYSYQPKQKIRP